MSAAAPPIPPTLYGSGQVPDEPIMRFTVDQYHEMIDKGILTDDDPVELLEGWLVIKMSKNPPHSVVSQLIREAIGPLLPTDWFVSSQEPITTKTSEPEPDVSVVKGRRRDYLKRHPFPHEVGLLVEVSDASLDRDRTIKKRIYAQARIPVYWIVNLIDKLIEVYTDPTGPGKKPDYRKRQDFKPGESIPVVLGGKQVGLLAVSEILP